MNSLNTAVIFLLTSRSVCRLPKYQCTGSAIGSNLGQIFRMDKKTMILLVGCGASAAIAGIFKCP